jgi:hypothetical protein
VWKQCLAGEWQWGHAERSGAVRHRMTSLGAHAKPHRINQVVDGASSPLSNGLGTEPALTWEGRRSLHGLLGPSTVSAEQPCRLLGPNGVGGLRVRFRRSTSYGGQRCGQLVPKGAGRGLRPAHAGCGFHVCTAVMPSTDARPTSAARTRQRHSWTWMHAAREFDAR